MLRRVCGPVKENDTGKIRYSNVYRWYDEPLIEVLKLKALKRAGHIQHVDGKRV